MSKTMTPVDERLLEYIHTISLREPELMKRLRYETALLGEAVACMQIAPEQGQFMGLLARLINARTYLEVGTFTGYSTLALALAMPADAHIVACDISREWTDIGRRYWREAGVDHKIDLRLAPAEQTLQDLLKQGRSNSFDLVFIDADKINYERYYELSLQLVRPGGLILIDNVLWDGAVAEAGNQEENTVAIRNLNARLHQDFRVDLSLITVVDGLTLARKRFPDETG